MKKPLPDDWRPNAAHVELAHELGIDGRFEEARFRDYAAGRGWRMVDWDATFRNWLRNAAERRPSTGGTAVAVRNGLNGRPLSTSEQRGLVGLEIAHRLREQGN